ncbi:MAG TPA: MBL fold metallo-hydrolase [Xanthobacteraceae bacterium]|nr:MBL fold metallo-hydrolase [Xanthobacteraceae bacterium]
MLFGTCNCTTHFSSPSSSLSRRGLLCAGGAGFVSALVATLVGSGRSAQAQTLSGPIPEVDRLRVRIVTDIIARRYATSQKLDGLTVQRLQGNETPDAPPRATLVGEWGLSMHAESQRGDELRNVLVDFGYNPATLLNNMEILKIAPESFDALVLSHGHYDHFGGLAGFLKATRSRLKDKLPFFVGGEDCFCTRMITTNGAQYGSLDRQAIVDSNLLLMTAEGPAVIADHAFTTGKIAQNSFETPLRTTSEKIGIVDGFGCFPDRVAAAKNTGSYIPDDFAHEIATNFLVKGKGLVVLTSCSHRGVINTIRQAQIASGIQKVHAVIGGFHLVPPLNDDYFRRIIAALKEINPDYLMPAHCTGEPFYDLVRQEMPGKVFQSNVGTLYTFTA